MNLKELDPYIVIPVTDAKVQDHADHALRIMEGEIEPGVRALWCDDEASVLAFLFDGRFTEEKARAWVEEAEENGVNLELAALESPGFSEDDAPPDRLDGLMVLLKPFLPPAIFDTALGLLGKEPIALIWEETENQIRYRVRDPDDFRPGTWKTRKLKGIEGVSQVLAKLKANKVPKGHNPDSMVVQAYRFDKKYWTMAKAKKWIAKQREKGNLSLESFGDIIQRVRVALEKLYEYEDEDGRRHFIYLIDIGPETAVFELDGFCWAIPYSINDEGEVLFGEPVATERAWKERESDRIIELTLYAFPIRGALATEASEEVVGDDEGLIWKEICKVSQWFKLATGRKIEITRQFLQDLVSAFESRVVPYVSVPADDHHHETGGVVPAESNTGFVEKLKLVGQSLWAGLRFTDDETREKVEQGTVKDVSIYAAPDVHDPRTGQKWPWVLMHVLLTNYPQVQGLAPFGNEEPVAADAFAGVKIIHLEEVNDMPDEITLTAEEARQFEALRALDLSPGQIAEWQAMGLSFERVKAMVAEEEATRSKARGLEVQAILLALQGQGEHDSVIQIPDTRHYPVVCEAVEKALKEQVEPLALDVGDNGTTGLDEVVLSIVNAIPAEGRMSLTAQPSGDKEPAEKNKQPTDEQIDDLDKRLR